ncbi:lipoprotein [Mycoplasma mycoides]|uniref:lipoprotein n=1 Tax=Mycoplasma mycoides TaxID=2102 RepID=UPI00223FC5CF|nr:lipoprotein [Mycoplasma mycoides]QVK03036.1 lipoprotein [Mycoplasma mycoides subsp. capri]QVK03852.1 lipoprotein [Mycoplasma mycoides subsp. capri]QVK08775.1 lipoprotein [Mycoplasma mycoides subsp. capri]
MKKLLTILGSIILITTTSTAVIACKNINQLELKNKETKQDKKEEKSNESMSNHKNEQLDESINDKESENHSNTENNEIQGDQSKENNEESIRNRKENFNLIKKYGKEFIDLLTSLGEKVESIDNNSNQHLLMVGGNIAKIYQDLMKYDSLDKLEKELKNILEKSGKSFNDFISDLEKDWDKVVKDYEKERETILSILKSLK